MDDEISVSYLDPSQEYVTIFVPKRKMNAFMQFMTKNFHNIGRDLHIRQIRDGYIVNIRVPENDQELDRLVYSIKQHFKTKVALIGRILRRATAS